MPKLETYNAPLNNASPDTQGANMLGNAALQVERLGRQKVADITKGVTIAGKTVADQVDRHNTMMEKSGLIANTAVARNTLQQSYDKTMADNPDDPDAGYKWQQEVAEPALRDVTQKGVRTPGGQETGMGLYHTNLSEISNMVHADQMNRHHTILLRNDQVADNATNDTIRRSPDVLDSSIAALPGRINTMISAAGVDPKDAETLHKEITDKKIPGFIASAVDGLVDRQNYSEAQRLLDAHSAQLPGQAVQALTEHIKDQQQKGQYLTENKARFDEWQRDTADTNAVGAQMTKAYNPVTHQYDPHTIDQLMSSNLRQPAKDMAFSIFRAVNEAKPDIRTLDPNVQTSLQHRVGAADQNFDADNLAALQAGKITVDQFEENRKVNANPDGEQPLINNARVSADGALKAITGYSDYGTTSPDVARTYAAAQQWLDQYVKTERAHGATLNDIYQQSGKSYWYTAYQASGIGAASTSGGLPAALSGPPGASSGAPAAPSQLTPAQSKAVLDGLFGGGK